MQTKFRSVYTCGIMNDSLSSQVKVKYTDLRFGVDGEINIYGKRGTQYNYNFYYMTESIGK